VEASHVGDTLRSFCCRLLGFSIERAAAVEHAFRTLELVMAHRASLVILGHGAVGAPLTRLARGQSHAHRRARMRCAGREADRDGVQSRHGMLSLLVGSWDRLLEERGLLALKGSLVGVPRGLSGVLGSHRGVSQLLVPGRLGEVRVPIAANPRAVLVVDRHTVVEIA